MSLYSMGYDVTHIFQPSVGVDLVFDIDSVTPVSRSSIIYDTDFKRSTITIAQPTHPISEQTRYNQLHLTTLIRLKNKRIRVGIPCRPVEFIHRFALANNNFVKAVRVKYTLPVKETNIRAAFRLTMSAYHHIKAKLIFQGDKFYTGKDFKFKDISFTGAGLIVPKKVDGRVNRLTGLAVGTPLPLGMLLMVKDQDQPVAKLTVKLRVVRSNPHYSETHMLVGLEIQSISQQDETLLQQFIHQAQVEELKRISQRS